MIPIILAAAATATPIPTKAKETVDQASWILSSDFPASEWKRATVTTFDLTIDQVGVPIKCTIIIPSGSEIVDQDRLRSGDEKSALQGCEGRGRSTASIGASRPGQLASSKTIAGNR